MTKGGPIVPTRRRAITPPLVLGFPIRNLQAPKNVFSARTILPASSRLRRDRDMENSGTLSVRGGFTNGKAAVPSLFKARNGPLQDGPVTSVRARLKVCRNSSSSSGSCAPRSRTLLLGMDVRVVRFFGMRFGLRETHSTPSLEERYKPRSPCALEKLTGVAART